MQHHKLLFFLLIASCCFFVALCKKPPVLHAITADDPCNKWPNCSICISNKFCGWCSTPVKYQDGSPGFQCAGFNPDNKTNPFVCVGTYSTDKCVVGYNCSAATKQCVAVQPGDGMPLDQCTSTCYPKYYSCAPNNVSCVETPQDHGGIPIDVCQAQCKASNTTPFDIIGHWRGLEISGGFIRGEWRLEVGVNNATLYYPSGNMVWQGTIMQVETYLVITISSGSQAGLKIYALYQTLPGAVTKWVTFGASRPGAPPPVSFDDAMASPTHQEFVFVSCLDASICNFQPRVLEALKLLGKPVVRKEKAVAPPIDHCAVFPNCTACLNSPFCGWCSTNVIYNGNQLGSNCAGFNQNSTDNPFICVGTYSTQQCPVPPPVYQCNSNTSQCIEAKSGMPGSVCNATCGKNHTDIMYKCNVATLTCEPNTGGQDPTTCNSTCQLRPFPIALTGVWRGLQVNVNYTKGEWGLTIVSNDTFTSSFVYTSPNNITLSGTLQHIASEAVLVVSILSPVVGKRYSLYELAYGPETAYLTLANGPADSDSYPSFVEAMTSAGMSEMNFVSCLNPILCKF